MFDPISKARVAVVHELNAYALCCLRAPLGPERLGATRANDWQKASLISARRLTRNHGDWEI